MVKHRTSIEFPPELWSRLCKGIPDRKKGKFIIDAVKEKLAKESLWVIILSGGAGTRMVPLTLNTSKAMLPIGYKPILQHSIEYLRGYGIYNFIISIGPFGEQIIKYFGDGSNIGVNIKYLSEKNPLGTGGAIKNAENLLNSTFIAMFGDVIFGSLDMKSVLKFHEEKGGLATIVLSETNDARGLGLAETDETDRIIGFEEKPKHAVKGWVNTGLFVFEPEIFKFLKSNKPISLEDDILPKLISKEKIFGYKYYGYWADIGKPEDYQKVCRDFFEDKIK